MNLPDYVTVGAHTYWADLACARWGHERISIGKWCSLSQQIKLLAGGAHRTDIVSTHPLGYAFGLNGPAREDRWYDKPDGEGIKIGNDVWIGFGASIIGNVTVGNGAVIAANATVFTDVPAYAVVAGNPAKVIKYRFDAEAIAALERIAWWNWSDEQIKARVDDFYLPVQAFLSKCKMQGPVMRVATVGGLEHQQFVKLVESGKGFRCGISHNGIVTGYEKFFFEKDEIAEHARA